MRYLLEGEWTGYTSAQRKVVHREVISQKKSDEIAAQRLSYIVYTDGTGLALSVRPLKPRESVTELRSYDSLIASCLRHKVHSVAALPND